MDTQTSGPCEKRLVDRFSLAAVLGVSPEKVKSLHRAGVLPAYQTGPKQLRFDVDECLARLRVEAPPERCGQRSMGAQPIKLARLGIPVAVDAQSPLGASVVAEAGGKS